MCIPEVIQALQGQQAANTGAAPQGTPSPNELFQMYSAQAPQQAEAPTYNYRAQLSPADIMASMSAGRQGSPAPITPTVNRTRTASPAPLTGAASAEKRYDFSGTQAPPPAAPAPAQTPTNMQMGQNGWWDAPQFVPIGLRSDGKNYPEPQGFTPPPGYQWDQRLGFYNDPVSIAAEEKYQKSFGKGD